MQTCECLICDCPFCKDFKRLNDVVQSRDVESLILLLKEFSNRWLNAAMDNEYYECIFNGSWPSSVEILKTTLKRIENHNHEAIKHKAYQLYVHRIKFGLQGDHLSDWLIAEHHVEREVTASSDDCEIPF